MFTHRCSVCDRRQLMFFNQVARATDGDGGLALTFTCWCGAEQEAVLPDATATRTLATDKDLVAA